MRKPAERSIANRDREDKLSPDEYKRDNINRVQTGSKETRDTVGKKKKRE